MESHVADSTAPKWFNLVLLTLFACIAIVLAAAGLYGTLAYIVSQCTAEIGIRLALGAQRSEVLRIVMRRGFILALAGIVVGSTASLAAAQLLSKLLFRVQPRDSLIFSVIPLRLIGVALTASYIPARRAATSIPLRRCAGIRSTLGRVRQQLVVPTDACGGFVAPFPFSRVGVSAVHHGRCSRNMWSKDLRSTEPRLT